MQKLIVMIGLLGCLIFSVFAAEMPLSTALKIAIEKNPDLQSAKMRKEAAQANIPKVLSLDDPQIGLEYEQIPSGSRNLEDGMKMYTAKQMILFPGKIYAQWQMANKEAEMFDARYQAKALEVAAQVKFAYYELFLSDRSIEVIREIRDLLSKIKRSAEAKYIVGEAVQADVLTANIEYLIMDNELTTMAQEREVKEAKLKALLDPGIETTIETQTVLVFPGLIGSKAELEKAAINNRPELLAMKAEFEAKDAAQLMSKMEYFPDTMLKVKKRAADGWDAMFSFSVPLYFWKQSFGVASVGFEREAAQADYTNMKNMALWMFRESWAMVNAAQRTTDLYEKKIVPQSSQALKVASKAYNLGKIDFQSLLQIERTYKEAKLKLYGSQVNYGKALAELDRIVGREVKQ